MASNLKYKQATNVERRTWDIDEYEQKAKARSEEGGHNAGDKRPLSSIASARQGDGEDDGVKEEFIPAAPGAAGPERSKRAFLKSRSDRVDIDSKVGSLEIVSADAIATTKLADDTTRSIKDGVTKTGVGWHCRVCDCFLKDSHTYLDHINGRKHQRSLGYSMRVEQSSKEQVQARLAELATDTSSHNGSNEVEIPTSFEDIVKTKDEEEQKRKKERARKREERKKRLAQQEQKPACDDGDEQEEHTEEINPDMATLMGFAGFGGGNKTR